MPRGSEIQCEQEYEKLKEEFHLQHRYMGREEEVAARIVNKQRSQHSETRAQEEDDLQNKSPDRELPIASYDRLDVDQIVAKLGGLRHQDLNTIKRYELKHNHRKTLLDEVDRRLV
jgi:hypothetical protein